MHTAVHYILHMDSHKTVLRAEVTTFLCNSVYNVVYLVSTPLSDGIQFNAIHGSTYRQTHAMKRQSGMCVC